MAYILQQQDSRGTYTHVRSSKDYDTLSEQAFSMLDEAKADEYNTYVRIVDEKGKALFIGECNNGKISYS